MSRRRTPRRWPRARMPAGPRSSRSVANTGWTSRCPSSSCATSRDLARGNFGRSIATGRPVGTDLARYFPATLELVILAMLLGVLLGVPLGVISALRKDGPVDHATRIFAVSGIALPPFWFGASAATGLCHLAGTAADQRAPVRLHRTAGTDHRASAGRQPAARQHGPVHRGAVLHRAARHCAVAALPRIHPAREPRRRWWRPCAWTTSWRPAPMA